MREIGIYIFCSGIICMLILQLCPAKYILTNGALSTSISKNVGGFMLPTHMLNRRGKTIKVMSYLLLLIGFIVIITGSI